MNRKRRRRPGVDARWCAVGAPWGQTNLDPDIVLRIVRLMREREAAGINTITNLPKWIELHKPVFSRTTARTLWLSYCSHLKWLRRLP
jgi:hypothetical protein